MNKDYKKVLNAYLTKRAMVLPYQVATGGSGSAYYNEGGDLGQVATYNKAPLAGMNFNQLAYTMNDAALWFTPPIVKAPQMLSKAPQLGKKLGTFVYNAYNRTPQPIKNMAANSSVTSLPYLGAEYATMNGVVGRPAPQGVAGGIASYGFDKSYNFANDQYNKALAAARNWNTTQPGNTISISGQQPKTSALGTTFQTTTSLIPRPFLANPILSKPIIK